MNIPFYVYPLFFLLIYIGIKRSYERSVSIERLFITPIIFISLSLKSALTLFEPGNFAILNWIIGGIIGTGLGLLHVRNRKINLGKSKREIVIPRDWSMLMLIIGIFSIEFIIHYIIESGSKIALSPLFKTSSLLLLGMIACTSLGRTICFLWKYNIENKSRVASI